MTISFFVQAAAEKFIHEAMSRLHTATKANEALGTAGLYIFNLTFVLSNYNRGFQHKIPNGSHFLEMLRYSKFTRSTFVTYLSNDVLKGGS